MSAPTKLIPEISQNPGKERKWESPMKKVSFPCYYATVYKDVTQHKTKPGWHMLTL